MINLAQIFVVLILIFAPWAFGATERWSQATIQILTGLAVVCVVGETRRDSTWRKQGLGSHWGWGVPLLILIGYIAVQALNASHQYQPIDRSLLPQAHMGWLPHSTDEKTTWEALKMLLTYAALFWVVCHSFRRVVEAKTLLIILVISGFGLALVAILQNVSGEQKLLWFRSSPNPIISMGPFVNRNNYAAYVNLLIPVALALGHYFGQIEIGARAKGHAGYLFYFMAAVMAVSVLRSGSRAGLLVCGLLITGWGVTTCVWRKQQRSSSRRNMFFGVALGLAAVGLLAYAGVEPMAARFTSFHAAYQEQFGKGTRLNAYRTAFAMFKNHWLYGTGAGTFWCAFPYYQSDSITRFWQYAHCDWLQYLAELGVIGSASLAALALGTLRGMVPSSHSSDEETGDRVGRHPLARPARAALVLSLIGVVLHGAVDFPLHIPSITTLAVVFAALLSTRQFSMGAASACL